MGHAIVQWRTMRRGFQYIVRFACKVLVQHTKHKAVECNNKARRRSNAVCAGVYPQVTIFCGWLYSVGSSFLKRSHIILSFLKWCCVSQYSLYNGVIMFTCHSSICRFIATAQGVCYNKCNKLGLIYLRLSRLGDGGVHIVRKIGVAYVDNKLYVYVDVSQHVAK